MTQNNTPRPQSSTPGKEKTPQPDSQGQPRDASAEDDVLEEIRRQARTVTSSLRRSLHNQVTGQLIKGVAGLVRSSQPAATEPSQDAPDEPHTAPDLQQARQHQPESRRPAADLDDDLPLDELLNTFSERQQRRNQRRQQREQERRNRATIQHDNTPRARRPDADVGTGPEAETPAAAAPPDPPATADRTGIQAGSETGKTDAVTPAASAQIPYTAPAVTMLNAIEDSPQQDQEEIDSNRQIIQDTIDSFGIDAEVGRAIRGPRVTLYEVSVARGVKVESISRIANNLAMELAAIRLRILTPVPGRDHVGIEVPNRHPSTVRLGAILNGEAWQTTHAKLPLPMGRDIHGQDIILDLAKAPHLLVAGATGSGKSVCLNSMIVSMLTRFSPDELRLILVDPKIVEFRVFTGLPHLLLPVLNDADTVPLALRWLLGEMERRYDMLADAGARDLDTYNSRIDQGPTAEEHGPQKLPRIVLIIDELADLMLSARNEVETALARLAQMARAVGIHAILSTQRPSVNVLTGIIKANFPTRMAFQVASQVDARTILDRKGAEALLGRGDVLFKPPGLGGLQRLQCPLVEDDELEAIADVAAKQRVTDPDMGLLTSTEAGAGPAADTAADMHDLDEDLVQQAIETVLRQRRASTSYLQRCFRIGYNRAASLMEVLEERGVVGPQIGSRPRDILLGWDEQEDPGDQVGEGED